MIEAVVFAIHLFEFQVFMYYLFRRRTAMPVATIIAAPQRYELKTLPDAFVIIRQMTYGEKMHRQNLTGAMKILKDIKSDFAGELAMETQKLTEWDFANLVVEHNLEGLNDPQDSSKGTFKLDFKNSRHVSMLNPLVGEEVGTYIDKLNTFDEVEQGNFEGDSEQR